MPALGERAAGDLVLLPLVFEDRVHGALAVGAPEPLDSATLSEIGKCVSDLALRLEEEGYETIRREAAD